MLAGVRTLGIRVERRSHMISLNQWLIGRLIANSESKNEIPFGLVASE